MGYGAYQRCELIGLAFVIVVVDNYWWSELRSTSVLPRPGVKHLPSSRVQPNVLDTQLAKSSR